MKRRAYDALQAINDWFDFGAEWRPQRGYTEGCWTLWRRKHLNGPFYETPIGFHGTPHPQRSVDCPKT